MITDRLDMKSIDFVSKNIESIAELFPNCVTETLEGKRIDFTLLQQELSGDIVDGAKERYRLEWAGKREAIVNANLRTTNTLRPIREDSVDFDKTENIYIEGDNLEVLKILQESYLNKIKMIYIDPPYNTGNDFIYKDDFKKSVDELNLEEGNIDEQRNRLVANSNSSGRYHSDWLSMMYPRLKLARNLLTEDGVIFISIDEHEVHNLRKICDEIFGEMNFIGEIIWETATDNNATQISVEHEYIICYAKHKEQQDKWQIKSEKAQLIQRKYEELKELHQNNIDAIEKDLRSWLNALKKSNKIDLSGVSHYSYVDEKGVFYPGNSANTKPGGYIFDIIHPVTKQVCNKPDNGYRWPETTFWEADKNGEVLWGEDENSIPKIKKRLDSATELLKSYFYEDNRRSTKVLTKMMGKKVFDNPKSINLLKKIIEFTTKDNDIVLDFFGGSSTTAEAVINLNTIERKNRLKFIIVQIQDNLYQRLKEAKAKTDKEVTKNAINFLETNNLKADLCEIGKERIRRAGKKIIEEQMLVLETKKGELNKKMNGQMSLGNEKELEIEELRQEIESIEKKIKSLDCGFRVFRLDSSNMKDVYYMPKDYKQENLELFATNIKEDRETEDLVAQVMLDWGLELSKSIEKIEVEGKEVYKIEDNALYCCFDEEIDEKFIRELAKQESHPLRIVFKDSSFKDDTAKENVAQLIKQLCPETEIKVI